MGVSTILLKLRKSPEGGGRLANLRHSALECEARLKRGSAFETRKSTPDSLPADWKPRFSPRARPSRRGLGNLPAHYSPKRGSKAREEQRKARLETPVFLCQETGNPASAAHPGFAMAEAGTAFRARRLRSYTMLSRLLSNDFLRKSRFKTL